MVDFDEVVDVDVLVDEVVVLDELVVEEVVLEVVVELLVEEVVEDVVVEVVVVDVVVVLVVIEEEVLDVVTAGTTYCRSLLLPESEAQTFPDESNAIPIGPLRPLWLVTLNLVLNPVWPITADAFIPVEK